MKNYISETEGLLYIQPSIEEPQNLLEVTFYNQLSPPQNLVLPPYWSGLASNPEEIGKLISIYAALKKYFQYYNTGSGSNEVQAIGNPPNHVTASVFGKGFQGNVGTGPDKNQELVNYFYFKNSIAINNYNARSHLILSKAVVTVEPTCEKTVMPIECQAPKPIPGERTLGSASSNTVSYSTGYSAGIMGDVTETINFTKSTSNSVTSSASWNQQDVQLDLNSKDGGTIWTYSMLNGSLNNPALVQSNSFQMQQAYAMMLAESNRTTDYFSIKIYIDLAYYIKSNGNIASFLDFIKLQPNSSELLNIYEALKLENWGPLFNNIWADRIELPINGDLNLNWPSPLGSSVFEM